MARDAVGDQREVGDHEADEDRREDADRFAHSAQVQVDQHHDDRKLHFQLDHLVHGRDEAEERIHAARRGDRDREHVVDDQGGPGHEARVRAHQLGGHLVAAAAVRKEFDDLVVGQRNDEHGEGGGDREIQRELAVLTERDERLGRAVRGGRQAVGADADPREKCGERDVLARLGCQRIAGRSEQAVPQAAFVCGDHPW